MKTSVKIKGEDKLNMCSHNLREVYMHKKEKYTIILLGTMSGYC